MKVTIIKAATSKKKPQNYCPWLVEDPPAPGK
jgi:hypothetical protein